MKKKYPSFLALSYKTCYQVIQEDMALKLTLYLNSQDIMAKLFPATHNILLSRHKPRWLNYSEAPFNHSQLGEYITFCNYFVNFKGPTNDWELLGETLIARVWVLNGVAIRSRSIGPIPSRRFEGFGKQIQPADVSREMDEDSASILEAMERD